MAELPYVPFYVSDWLGSPKVRRLSLEARAAYVDLLLFAWDLGSIPTEGPERAHMLGIPRTTEAKLWREVAPFWESDGNGGLVNPKLEKVREQQRVKRKAGKAGGKARAGSQAHG